MMRIFKPALIVVFLTGLLSISSLKAQDIHYKFAIADVTSLATAKPVTTIIRSYFNTEDQPNKYFPAFDVNTQQYDFISSVVVSESSLRDILLQHGYTLNEFEYEISKENTER